MRRHCLSVCVAIALLTGLPSVAMAQADLYVADRPADTGAEPNADPSPMWLSEDIWIRTTPDPAYLPDPYTLASPTWTPAAHQNPEYRDPRYGIPNYVYVRVRNRGDAASTGNETLQLYWSKASTGLSWPASWANNFGPVCGVDRMLGAEITKPRKNVANATDDERTQYIEAFKKLGSDPAFALLSSYNYWTKQQHVHALTPEHKNPAFLPWHREFINRLEVLLQEADPRVRLLYWQWRQDPTNTTGTNPGSNLFVPTFMGASGRGTSGVSMGSTMSALQPIGWSAPAVGVVRQLSPATASIGTETDATIVGRSAYRSTTAATNFSDQLERPSHDNAHVYMGGGPTGVGDVGEIGLSTRDPFFFLLHGKVDERWANWQRANPARTKVATAYGTASTDPAITSPVHPWDGLLRSGATAMDPWTSGTGFIVSKTNFDRSILSPPIYDSAPLRIPALAPGQAVVLEIPWYPPNPNNYACLGDMRHFCLLSRVEQGITTPETSDVNANVRNNNNLAWKNIEIVDDFSGAMAMMSMLVANDTEQSMATALQLREPANRQVRLGDHVQAIHVGLPAEIFKRMETRGQKHQRFKRSNLERRLQGKGSRSLVPSDTVFLQLREGEATLPDVALKPGERFPFFVVFELKPDYKPTREVLKFDVVQRRNDPNGGVEVGGVQAQLDLSALHLVKERGQWRVAPGVVEGEWHAPRFDDAQWREAPAPFGFGSDLETRSGVVPGAKAAYFRKAFDVQDPRFLRDLTLRLRADAPTVVYLNGREVHRTERRLTGAAENAFFPVKLPVELLRSGTNVLAAEVRGADGKDAALVFDAALLANRADTAEAPTVRIGVDEVLVRAGKPAKLGIDAVDPDGRVRKVAFFVDGQEVGSAEGPNAAFEWTPREGTQRLRAVAEDDAGLTTIEEREVVGVENLPPKVRMQARPGKAPGTMVLSAEAIDDDGRIRQVEFFVAQGTRFDAPFESAGIATQAPFEVTVELPPGEHRIVTAEATDDGGAVGVASTHVDGEGHH